MSEFGPENRTMNHPPVAAPLVVQEELAIRQSVTTTEKNCGQLEARTITTTTNAIDVGDLNGPCAKQDTTPATITETPA